MTEITRVPLRPIAKGSLAKLWVGVAAAVLAGAGLAWAAVPAGVEVDAITEGTGASPKVGDVAFINYVGKLENGTEFDRSRPLPIPPGLLPDGTPLPLEEGQVIPGFIEGLTQMKKGGKYTLTIPAADAYGDSPPPGSPIPAGANLVFEIELLDIMSRQDFEGRIAVLQQMMAQQQGRQGGAGENGPLGPPEGDAPQR